MLNITIYPVVHIAFHETCTTYPIGFFTLNAYFQSDMTWTGEKIFQLGEARMTGIKNLAGINAISSSRLEKPNQLDVSGALNTLKQGAKQNPPYLGTDREFKARLWRWPKWDQESLSLLSNSSSRLHYQLKTRWYHDTIQDLPDGSEKSPPLKFYFPGIKRIYHAHKTYSLRSHLFKHSQ